MAKTLSSKAFRSDEDDFINNIADFIDKFTGKGAIGINVQICVPDQTRLTKQTATQILESICVDGTDKWELHEYKFFFLAKKYYWKGNEIHLTAGEALFLYRWLIQCEYEHSEQYYLYNMRKKFGDTFLVEMFWKEGK
ncbi:hypothetical protein FACS1894109_15510 [Spirochaetia bacterium]|nr:hypothetical protein FACS1894109_15510 [Spirochaetia bacterium]